MRTLFSFVFITLALGAMAQEIDSFAGTYIQKLDDSNFKMIIIAETEDCYSGQYGNGGQYDVDLQDMRVECNLDEEEDYFFLIVGWEQFDFEIKPLEWDDQDRISSFELIDLILPDEPGEIYFRSYE
jgi:hypothetical protein